jgi:8-oxo-dGTP pyrophosphatase MutT (NUDIX family)
MDYVTNLRRKVGHDPLILPGGTLLALNSNKELLMMKRTDNQCWGIPGGMMEPGESPEQAAIRETEEEIGLHPHELQLFGVYGGEGFFYVYPNGDQVFNLSVVYLCRDFSGVIKLDKEEHSEFRFFPLNNLPDNISPPILPILQDLVEQFSQEY